MQKNTPPIINTVLLLALPASGKSEIRKYLSSVSCLNDFHIGATLQLDDYPYVHMMRRIDDELVKRNKNRVFFYAPDQPFCDPKQWGTLIELLNEDYADLLMKKTIQPKSAAHFLIQRLNQSAHHVGATHLESLDSATLHSLTDCLEKEAQGILDERNHTCSQDDKGKTIVIEFARGGAYGSSFPLPEPFGYQYSLGRLSPQILKNASILYIWVTPEESRRKNQERANPNDPGSILHHGVPHEVMMNDYGCDDIHWLEEHSKKPHTLTLTNQGQTYWVPYAKFDNRMDKTSFLRNPQKDWKPHEIQAVHQELKKAFHQLWEQQPND